MRIGIDRTPFAGGSTAGAAITIPPASRAVAAQVAIAAIDDRPLAGLPPEVLRLDVHFR